MDPVRIEYLIGCFQFLSSATIAIIFFAIIPHIYEKMFKKFVLKSINTCYKCKYSQHPVSYNTIHCSKFEKDVKIKSSFNCNSFQKL